MASGSTVWLILIVVLILTAIATLFVAGHFLQLYIQAVLSHARVSFFEIVAMRLRRVDVRTIVLSRIRSLKAGLDVPTSALVAHYLAGGRVPHVISAMIAAKGAGIDLSWDTAAAMDLAGEDVLDAVQMTPSSTPLDRRPGPDHTPAIDARHVYRGPAAASPSLGTLQP